MQNKITLAHPFRTRGIKGERKLQQPKNPVRVVPDQSLKVKDIVQRYLKGMPVTTPTGTPKPVYPDQETLSLDSLDLNQMQMKDEMEQKDFARSMRLKRKKVEKRAEGSTDPNAPSTDPPPVE